MPKNVLFLANLPDYNIPKSIGGATVLAEKILDYIQKNPALKITHKPIRKTWIPKLHLIDHFILLFKLPFYLRKVDVVSVHATWDFNFSSGPLAWMIIKLFRKKVIFHFFGSDFHTDFQKLPKLLRFVYRNTILKSDTLFFETKQCIKYFESIGVKNLAWLPNARQKADEELTNKPKTFSKKFVFISRIVPKKGILDVIEVANLLDDSYTVDVYGPFDYRYLNEEIFKDSKATYKGNLQQNEVLSVLNQYDVLLLPTTFTTEGYPGIIVEAQSLGIPAITTRYGAIPEIVEHQKTGLLIEPNVEELEKAIKYFNPENMESYRKASLKFFDEHFNMDKAFQKIVKSYLE